MKTKIRKIKPYYCPNPECKKLLRGGPIPKEQQHLFGSTHFGREIGIYSLEEDRTIGWKCPYCAHEWVRGLK